MTALASTFVLRYATDKLSLRYTHRPPDQLTTRPTDY